MPGYTSMPFQVKGVHVVTVNRMPIRTVARTGMGELVLMAWFVSRDLTWLGVSMEKRSLYECDITYSTNSEIGFRLPFIDNMVVRAGNMDTTSLAMPWSMRFDSILIDRGACLLIVSGANAVETSRGFVSHGRPLCQIFGQRRLYHRCAV